MLLEGSIRRNFFTGIIYSYTAIILMALPMEIKDKGISGAEFSIMALVIPILFGIMHVIFGSMPFSHEVRVILLGFSLGVILAHITIVSDMTYSIYDMDNPRHMYIYIPAVYSIFYHLTSALKI